MWKYLSHHAIYQLESIHINLDLYNKYIEKKQENLIGLENNTRKRLIVN